MTPDPEIPEQEPRKHHAPRRRAYRDDPARKRSVDTLSRVQLWGPMFIGSGVGLAWGMVIGAAFYGRAFLGGGIGLLLGAGLTYLGVRLLVGGAGHTVASVLIPSGASTAYKRQYSDAEAAAAQGNFPAAVAGYQRYILEDPADPEPYFRIARICREHLQDFEQAAMWYRRVRTEISLDGGRDLLATQELAGLYIHKLRQPRKAIPELARLVQRFPGTPPAKAAADELAQLREMMTQEDDDGESLTGRFYKKKD